MKVTRTEPPQSDPMFYAKLLEENKQLKEQLAKTEKSLDNHMAYISKLKI